jgi:branched-chain amino acid transport system permease protein
VLTDAARRASALTPRAAATVLAGAIVGLWFLVSTWQQAGGFSSFLQFTIIGLSIGCVYAVVASGLVLTYTTTGVFNFAHGAVGMVCAFSYHALRVDAGFPAPLAIVLVVVVLAPLIGLVFELIMRSFRGSPPGTTLTVTIALTILLIGVAQTAFQSSGQQRTLPFLFGQRTVEVLGVNLRWDEVSAFVVAVAIAAVLRALLYRSRTGVAMRAVVDNADLAGLNGAKPVTIARYSWMLGSVLAGLGGVLIAPFSNPLEPIVLTFFVLSGNAYGAAVFGRLRSLPLTFVGALILGLLKSFAPLGFPLAGMPEGEIWNHLQVSLPGVFLFVVLLGLPDARLTVGRIVTRDAPRVPGLIASLVRGAAFVPVAWFAAIAVGTYLTDLTQGLIYGTLLLSLVLLTGFSGQISLAQYVFFGLGAFAMGKVAGGDSVLGLAAAAGIAIPAGIIAAIPAIRLQGLYLALVTFAVAIMSQQMIFQNSAVYGRENVVVGRPDILGVSFRSNRAFAVLCALAFTSVAIGVLALRRGAFGRRLAALRDSQAACATLGLDVRRTKLTVFALSASIAGFAGALQGGLAGTAGSLDFEPIYNVTLFLFAFVGGITTVSGALIGGMLFALLPLVQSEAPRWAGGVVFAVIAATAILLGRQPNGLAGLVFARAEAFRRSLAGRSPGPAARPAARAPAAPARGAPPKEVAGVNA